MNLLELFDKPIHSDWVKNTNIGYWIKNFVFDGNQITIKIHDAGSKTFIIYFGVNGSVFKSEEFGSKAIILFEKVVGFIKGFLLDHIDEWSHINFSGIGKTKIKLYTAICNKIIKTIPNLRFSVHDGEFWVSKKNTQINELFSKTLPTDGWVKARGFNRLVYRYTFYYRGREVLINVFYWDNAKIPNFKINPDGKVFYVEFVVDGNQYISNVFGQKSIGLFENIVALLKSFLISKKDEWDYVFFETSLSPSKNKLYTAICKKICKEIPNLKFESKDSEFLITKTNDQINELFKPKENIKNNWEDIHSNGRFSNHFTANVDEDYFFVELEAKQDRNNHLLNDINIQNKVNIEVDDNKILIGYNVAFQVNKTIYTTNELGQKSFNLWNEIISRYIQFFESHNWDYICFYGDFGKNKSKNKLYLALAKKFATRYNAIFMKFKSDFIIAKPGVILNNPRQVDYEK